MELVKLVNRGLAGEPEILCFQNPETTKIYDFSEIYRVCIGGEYLPFNEDDWKLVLEKENHMAHISIDESNKLVLYV